jgi:hypothetical protein
MSNDDMIIGPREVVIVSVCSQFKDIFLHNQKERMKYFSKECLSWLDFESRPSAEIK